MSEYIQTEPVPILTRWQAQYCANLLPVRLRDFWLAIDPHVQYYLYSHSSSEMELFSLVDMEYARFFNAGPKYNWARFAATAYAPITGVKLKIEYNSAGGG
jgi:hypothetical protein